MKELTTDQAFSYSDSKESDVGEKAKTFFLGLNDHKKLNCAQALSKAFINDLDFIDEELIKGFKKMGNGRAPGGECGIVFAARFILENTNHEEAIPELEEKFVNFAGTRKCKELKKRKIKFCALCLERTAEFIKRKV